MSDPSNVQNNSSSEITSEQPRAQPVERVEGGRATASGEGTGESHRGLERLLGVRLYLLITHRDEVPNNSCRRCGGTMRHVEDCAPASNPALCGNSSRNEWLEIADVRQILWKPISIGMCKPELSPRTLLKSALYVIFRVFGHFLVREV
jgi:hypothetical protein